VPEITDISEQRRRKSRVNVFIDGEFWCGMDRLCQIELGLAVGLEVSAARITELERHVSENEALLYCVASLSARARTETQMRTKLLDKGYSETVAQDALARCYELLLLNDETYARAVAIERRSNGQGRRRVQEKLRADGVAADLAEEILAEVFDSADDEVERARAALKHRFPPPLSRVDQRRAHAFLLRRGFGSTSARVVVDSWAADTDLGPSAEEALALLRRKYPALDLRHPQDIKRAQGFLARRGCSFEVTRAALQELRV
jgi:regulatory protein